VQLGNESSEYLELDGVDRRLKVADLALDRQLFLLLLEVSSERNRQFGAVFLVLLRGPGLSDQQDGAGMPDRWIGERKLLSGSFLVGVLWEVVALLEQMQGKLRHNEVEFDLFRLLLLDRYFFALAHGQQGQSKHEVELRLGGGLAGGLVDEQPHHRVLHPDLHVEDDLLHQLPEKVHRVALVQFSRLLLLENLRGLLPHGLLEVIGESLVGLQVHLQPLRHHLDAARRQLGPSRQRDLETAHPPMVQDVGRTEQVVAVDLLEVEADVGQQQLPVLEILQRDLIRQQFVQRTVKDVLD
jgi:hypothetical protein